jgi:hypothetical protein
MATTRIKDLSKTATTVASDANIVIDGSSNGTQKIARDNFRQDTADAYVAAPSTYKLTPLNGVNKIDAAYLPTSGDTPKGEWNASTNSPTLADGTGTAGDYYDVTTAGTANLGSVAITYTVGDVVKYNGATWFKIDSVANILDGISTVDPAKAALQIPNVGTAANEVSVNGMLGTMAFQSSAGVVVDDLTVDGQLTAAVGKPMPVNGPSMRFDGSNDEISFAATTDSPFSFTNGTDDTPFAIACWTKMTDATSFVVVSKQQSAREYVFRTDSVDKLRLNLSDGSNIPETEANTSLTEYENQWVHLCVTYSGAGPNSSRAFSDAASGIQFYINAKLVGSTATNKASYSGMNASSDQVRIGKQSTSFADGEIRDVKLFNKELSAAEVREVYSNGQLSFAESTGGADGGVYTSNFSVNSDSHTNTNGTVAGNVDSIGGQDDNLSFTLAAGNLFHYASRNNSMASGKRYRISLDYYIPSSNSNADGIRINTSSGSVNFAEASAPTLDTWNTISGVAVNDLSTGYNIYPLDGGSVTFDDAGGDDVFYLRNVRVTQIGAVLDARAEQFDTSTGKLYDLSGNDFVGTQSGGVQSLGKKFPVYQTGTWTPSITFGGASVGTAYTYREGVYTRVGDEVTCHGIISLLSKGSSIGNFGIEGLPLVPAGGTYASYNSGSIGYVANMGAGGMTTQPMFFANASNSLSFYKFGGGTVTNTDTADNLALRFSITYQIQ